MGAFHSVILDALFLFAVSVIWMMILYQLVMSFWGYRYYRSTRIKEPDKPHSREALPSVSILIPARNEEVVIKTTLNHILSMDYPEDKMEVILINDGSTDKTAMEVESVSARYPQVRMVHLSGVNAGKGKAHALNFGLKSARNDLIAVYDADNCPEPSSLRILVMDLISNDHIGAVIGKFRTLNKKKNLLTRFINIETLSFQWILQAGRYLGFGITILPGTNFVIRREVLDACKGWDEDAITEDSELSVRVYQKGWKMKFVPAAVTWEQEPEKWSVWVRQRTRWVRGNNYVIKKFLKQALRLKNRFLMLEFLHLFILYYLFLGAIIVSHLFFLLCGLGILSVTVPGPYTAVWISAFLLYLLEIILVLSFENEDSLINIFCIALMYFTYCQMWIYVVFKAFYMDFMKKRVGVWDKTERVLHVN